MLSSTRVGKFTSSEIFNLMKKGKGSLPSVATGTYIEEKVMERKLGRSLNADVSSRPTIWGSVVEKKLYSLLDPFEYQYCSSETVVHKSIGTWAGTPDFLTKDLVADGKCPYTLKSFCQLAEMSISGDVEKLKATKPEYYWQLVSNAVLTDKKKAELITYCPYKSELASIKELVENEDNNQTKYAWIYFSEDEDLPYLVDGEYYKNMYRLVFTVPELDVELLTSAVVEASKQLEVA